MTRENAPNVKTNFSSPNTYFEKIPKPRSLCPSPPETSTLSNHGGREDYLTDVCTVL